jgi:hypothetical protein
MEGNLPELYDHNPYHNWRRLDLRKPNQRSVNRQVYYENGLARIKLERDIGRLSIYDYDDNGKIVAIREYRVKSEGFETIEEVVAFYQQNSSPPSGGPYPDNWLGRRTDFPPHRSNEDIVLLVENTPAKRYTVRQWYSYDARNANTKGGLGAYQGDKLEGLYDAGLVAYGIQPMYSHRRVGPNE